MPDKQPIDWQKLAGSIGQTLLFFHLLTLFTVLMIRVLLLPNTEFVLSLEQIGGFFKDTGIAAVLFMLLRANFAHAAAQALRNVGAGRRIGGGLGTHERGPMGGYGGYADDDEDLDRGIRPY